MSYRPMMRISESELAGNGLRFATAIEAESQAAELMTRWIVPIGYEVEESDDAVNYRWDSDACKIVSI